jgi:hypothetical protein
MGKKNPLYSFKEEYGGQRRESMEGIEYGAELWEDIVNRLAT